jgi:hypothetical protein
MGTMALSLLRAPQLILGFVSCLFVSKSLFQIFDEIKPGET